ncbi:hypothetical protein [Bullifex porci]|uniref:hypothetical protein n=1 Tax=Bullifex porci TaxID=2606638 RepID=UPI0023F395A3|nr:hypothetical protein [Bullifex porci]MDD7255634.1 hypothetical protein [Bullifex porci]
MKLISRLTDILGIGLGIVIFTLMPYEIFGIAGVVWFYFWTIVGLLFLKSKPGKRLIDWSISHD